MQEGLEKPHEALGKNLYRQFKTVVCLEAVMRQQGDEQKKFRDLLNSFRDGTVDVPEWEMIDSRALNRLSEEEKAAFEKDALMLCSTNKALKPFNVRKMREIGNPIGKLQLCTLIFLT